jgi:Esterase/lipase
MLGQKIVLWNEDAYEKKTDTEVPYMDLYILPKREYDQEPSVLHHKKRPMIIICPGGSYEFICEREADPIALKYLSRGFNVAVLHYSVNYPHPQPLLDVAKAILMIRQNAEEYYVDSDKIIVCGFSAGGHLACTIGTLWNEPYLAERLGVKSDMLKPNVQILGYAVTTTGEYGDDGCNNVLAADNEKVLRELSLENRVTKDTAPAYIWHTTKDNAVPVMNAIVYAEALSVKGVNYEMHIFPRGCHGLSISEEETSCGANDLCDDYIARWIDESINFINTTFSR